MDRRANPIPLFEIGVSALLSLVGFTGLVMGWRESLLKDMSKTGYTPQEPTPEPTVPPVETELAEKREWMEENYPGGDCYRKGWARGWSVTGPEDGFSLEWEIYERPKDPTWKAFAIWAMRHPEGVSFGAEPFYTISDADEKAAELEGRGFRGYESRQKYLGSPYVSKPKSSGYYAC